MNRIWIYQSKRTFSEKEHNEISTALDTFVKRWAAHSKKLDARFEILHNHFIALTVNQEEIMASGCSIDDSVRFMQDLDKTYNLSLFDRQLMAYIDEDENIKVCGLNEIAGLHKSGKIQGYTYIFNNLIQDANEMALSWKIPFKDSGYFAMIN